MPQGPFLRKYGVQTTVDFHTYEVDGIDLRKDAVPGTADLFIMKDEGAEANATNAATDEGRGYSLVLTATEMQAARIVVYVEDQTGTKVWLDTVIVIETYGNASAMHAIDLDDSVRAGLTGLANAVPGASGGLLIAGANSAATSFTAGVTISNAGGDALTLSSGGSNGDGLSVSGNGAGHGVRIVAGATGNGVDITGGSSSGHGMDIAAGGAGTGVLITGTSTGSGFRAIGGNTNGSGISLSGNGSGAGLKATGGASGAGVEAVGGATSGDGISATLGGSGVDIRGDITGNLTGTINGLTATALADLFDTDSGTTYAAAATGSVVKEIADNAGGSALTEAGIADAVWDEAQSGHVAVGSFGEVATEIAGIETQIGTAGDGLSAVPWNAAWDAEVQSEVNDGLVALGLDHLLGASVTGTDITDNSIFAKLVSSSATADWDSFVNTSDSLQAARDHVGDGTNLSEAGGDGDHLTAVNLPNQTMDIVGNITGNLSGSVGSVTGNVGGVAGTITTLDALDTAQDTQHSTTQTNIATAQADLDILTGTDGATLATSQPNYAPATATALATVDTVVDAVKAVTDVLPDSGALTSLAQATNLATVDTVVDAIKVVTDALTAAAAAKLALTTATVATGTVNDASATTTTFITDLAEATDDHYNGLVFAPTSGVLVGQKTDITDYDGGTKTLTVTALTEAPANGISFVIL